MSDSPAPLRLEDLQWLRALAARLVRDPHLADDAVQDTLVAALGRGPSEPSALRGWLARVLRNCLNQEWRSRARRTAREGASAPVGAHPSTLEVVEELALHRRLAEAVHALDEPYRTAILLRYLRGLSSDEIARQLGAPVKTVRTRLERGVEALRERLGRERSAWALLLAGAPDRGIPLAPWPALLLTMKLKLLVSLVACSLGAFLWLRETREEPASAPPITESPQDLAHRGPELTGPSPARRESVAAPERVPAAQPAPQPIRSLHGFVRTLEGQGLAGVEVILEEEHGERFTASPESPRTRSESGGRFELPLTEPRGRLNVLDPDLAGVVTPHLDGAFPPAEPILVVAPSRTYAGRVLDPEGAPVQNARLEITLDGPIVQSRDVGGTPVHLLLPFAETRSDARGAFALARVAYVEGATLEARADGFQPGSWELPLQSDERLELVLQPSASPRLVHGLVLQASGLPAAGARVSLGADSATCDGAGAFVLACEDWRTSGWLRAILAGHVPAEASLEEALASSSTSPVVLRLGPAPLSIRGRVLDEDGTPLAGAAVFSPDTTPFGTLDFEEEGHTISGLTTAEAFLGGKEQHPWEALPSDTTAADGGFRLDGLLDRPYALFVLDARGLDGLGPVLVRAGEANAELRLSRAPARSVAGRVVSRTGQPLAGVRVRPGRTLDWGADVGVDSRWTGFALVPPPAAWTMPERAVTTDAQGAFDLGLVVTRGTFLSLSGSALVLGGHFELDGAGDPGALEVVVAAASRFQVVPSPADAADSFTLEQPAGHPVVLFLEVEGLTITATRATIEGGRSGVVLTKEGEYELVLYARGEERRRVPVRLSPGGIHELTP